MYVEHKIVQNRRVQNVDGGPNDQYQVEGPIIWGFLYILIVYYMI